MERLPPPGEDSVAVTVRSCVPYIAGPFFGEDTMADALGFNLAFAGGWLWVFFFFNFFFSVESRYERDSFLLVVVYVETEINSPPPLAPPPFQIRE